MSVDMKIQQARLAAFNGLVVAMQKVAVNLQREIKQILSRPGTGRVYQRKSRRSITRSQAAGLLRQRRAAGRKNRSLRSLGFYKASAPGQPPAVQTGNLRRSWQFASQIGSGAPGSNRYTIRVGSAVRYAAWLEEGTTRMRARPYVLPSVEKIRPTVEPIVRTEVQRALRMAFRSVGP
jgi:hypothetical protein